MSILNGQETAIIQSSDLKLKIGKYRIYRVKLATHTRIFIVDHVLRDQYRTGLKRITNDVFVCINGEGGLQQ